MKTRTNIVWNKSWALLVFLFLGIGCSGELESPSVEHPIPGITFLASDVSDGPSVTRGYFEEQKIGDRIVYAPNWDMKDSIRIFATNTNKYFGTAWTSGMQPVIYRASQAGRLGKFQAADASHALEFRDKSVQSEFLAVYSPDADWDVSKWTTGSGSLLTASIKTLPSLSRQKQLDEHGRGIFELMTRYSYTVHDPSEGDEVKLNFRHVLSGLVFETCHTDQHVAGADYAIGPLVRIRPTLTSDASLSSSEPRCVFIYNRGKTTLTLSLPVGEEKVVSASLANSDPSTNKDGSLNLDFEWTDNARGYYVTNPLSMATLSTPEFLRVAYDFGGMEVVQTHEMVRKDWNPGTLYRVPVLDLDSFNYLVLKGGDDYESEGGTLVLREGAQFDRIYQPDGQKVVWNWTRRPLGGVDQVFESYVPARNISRVVSYIDLTDSQKAAIEAGFAPGVVIEKPDSTFLSSPFNYAQVESDIPLSSLTDEQGNIIPDFSNVGYMGSEAPIPDVPVAVTVSPSSSNLFADMTQTIQAAIDEVSSKPLVDGFRGAVLLKEGYYLVSGVLKVVNSGVVIRGEGEGKTTVVCTAKQQQNLFEFAGTGSMTPDRPYGYNVKDAYVPVGRFWVRVTNPSSFRVGDNVTVYRPGTDAWIHDLKMDQIPEGPWQPSGYNLVCERKVTAVRGDTLHFDNPIMMALDNQYGGGAVYKSSWPGRISHCGIENLTLESQYVEEDDEQHGWTAITMSKVEHCWVRNVKSLYFGFGLISINDNSRFVTVKDSKCYEAKSIITGGRRYPFNLNYCQQCLVIDCESTEGRHDCATGGRGVGPNAFVRVKARNTHSDTGPHHRWNVGTLYDNIDTDGQMSVEDRWDMGTGHGWSGANQVFWNCTARGGVRCFSPWVSAKNYSIGTKGMKLEGHYPGRPDGVWVRHNETVSPQSLFDAQLALRKRLGRLYHVGK